ncbi:MAG: hypothetical protein ACI8QS_001448 [Planctomycetota bacterium]|jgi:hypothetical protein
MTNPGEPKDPTRQPDPKPSRTQPKPPERSDPPQNPQPVRLPGKEPEFIPPNPPPKPESDTPNARLLRLDNSRRPAITTTPRPSDA